MRKNESGFTLIELMIVIAIIAIIAAIAIPNLLAAKLSANETAALATLRNLASCQAQVQTSGKIDCDNDGIGEYGTFLEMTGSVAVRKGYTVGTPASSDFSTQGTAVNPAILSPSLANVDANGFVTKSGYAFMIFLPDSAAVAAWVNETGPAASVALTGGSGTIGVDMSETTWCAYAQPVAHGNSGNRRFFVYQSGDVMQSANDTTKFQGVNTPIVGSSAFRGAGITSAVAIGTKGNDGDVWKVTN
jgi:prepilin-type N-terminal cleavage/methylation domain-containing protein